MYIAQQLVHYIVCAHMLSMPHVMPFPRRLNAVSNPSPADVREFETCVVSLAAANPTAVPEASSLLDGR